MNTVPHADHDPVIREAEILCGQIWAAERSGDNARSLQLLETYVQKRVLIEVTDTRAQRLNGQGVQARYIRELMAELAAAKADTARLDHLYSTHSHGFNQHGACNRIWFEWPFTDPDLRGAIDADMAKAQSPSSTPSPS